MGTDIHGVWQRRTGAGWEDVPSVYEQDRHYQLFAVLADVRNGYGFAGIRTGEPVTPISCPRGLPEDFTVIDEDHPVMSLEAIDPRRRKWHEEGEPQGVWMGDHSHSWLSGSEMLGWFDKAPIAHQTGVLSRKDYGAWDGRYPPARSCGDITGPNVVKIADTPDDKIRTPAWTHIQVVWESPLHEELAYFFDEVRRLIGLYGEIRFVFGFDS